MFIDLKQFCVVVRWQQFPGYAVEKGHLQILARTFFIRDEASPTPCAGAARPGLFLFDLDTGSVGHESGKLKKRSAKNLEGI